MITNLKPEVTVFSPEGGIVANGQDHEVQRGGAGFLSFLLFPAIAVAALVFAAAELAR